MLARNEVIFKWVLYGAATALCFLFQGGLFQRIPLLGVIPFIYPMLAAIPATFESPAPAGIFALCLGVFCDLLLPDAFPCLYTLVFPAVGICASIISQKLLPAGFRCSLVVSAAAFLLTDLFRCLILSASGHSAVWGTGLLLLLKEFLVSAPLLIPLTLLYRTVARKVHTFD